MYHGQHAVVVALSDEVADEGGAGGTEGHERHKGEGRDVANDVGGGQIMLPEMLDGQKEDKPRAERQEILYHYPHAQIEHIFQNAKAKTRHGIEGIFCAVDATRGIDKEEEEGNDFRQGRTDGRTLYAQSRETEFAEDQNIVEDDVAQHHDEGVERERAGVGGADIKGAKNEGDEGKGDARHAPRQVDI